MNWNFINSGFNSGKFNMEFDINLASNCKSDEAFFRLYRWKPYCISLGAYQNINKINISKVQRDGIDVVKRPTGGRAILHAEEITYSVIYPLSENISARNLYNQINFALKKGLEKFDDQLINIQMENSQIDFRSFYQTHLSNICFAASAKSELKYFGKKLAGSAQKKFKNSILQHGSILCSDYHRKIIDYLNLNGNEYSEVKLNIENKTTDLRSILNYEINYDELSESLISGFTEYFKAEFKEVVEV